FKACLKLVKLRQRRIMDDRAHLLKENKSMTIKKPIAVLGGGSFGTALANLLASNQHSVHLWMRNVEQAGKINENKQNPRYLKGVPIQDGVRAVTALPATIAASDLIIVALPSTALRSVLPPYAQALADKMLI